MQTGFASWYGNDFHGRKTASGETYDMYAFTAAHRTAPFGSLVRVTHLETGASTVVRINDRGPFVRGRIIDLSRASAKDLGMIGEGTARVRLAFLERTDPVTGGDDYFIQLGSFREESNAQKMLRSFTKRFPSRKAQIVSTGELFRLQIGPISGEPDTVRAVQDLRRAGYRPIVLRR